MKIKTAMNNKYYHLSTENKMLCELYSYPCALYRVTLRTKLWGHYRYFHPINGHLGSTFLQSILQMLIMQSSKRLEAKLEKKRSETVVRCASCSFRRMFASPPGGWGARWGGANVTVVCLFTRQPGTLSSIIKLS